jgi:hypothetical protein
MQFILGLPEVESLQIIVWGEEIISLFEMPFQCKYSFFWGQK